MFLFQQHFCVGDQARLEDQVLWWRRLTMVSWYLPTMRPRRFRGTGGLYLLILLLQYNRAQDIFSGGNSIGNIVNCKFLGKTSKKNCIKSENGTIGGEGGQKNYWIFIIYKWWKKWKGESQSNISLLHRTQLWLI